MREGPNRRDRAGRAVSTRASRHARRDTPPSTSASPAITRPASIARRGGKEIGHDSARFLVYQDDRELENPSADLKLAREIAELTGGEVVTPEKLSAHLKAIDRSAYTEYVTDSQYEIWDNWPFLLIFAAILTLEWWLRKRHGWV